MTPDRQPSGPLAPLVSALLTHAQDQARATVDAAQAEADQVIGRARDEADALLSEARAKGRSDGTAVVAAERARAERSARGILLSAQRAAHDRARAESRAAVAALRADPRYPQIRQTLRDRALQQLGPDATVEEPPCGGVVAVCGDRRLDLSFDALADDIVDRMGADAEGIWAS
jgi:vacuolar-type H+-ATPase subunit E/Vma4